MTLRHRWQRFAAWAWRPWCAAFGCRWALFIIEPVFMFPFHCCERCGRVQNENVARQLMKGGGR